MSCLTIERSPWANIIVEKCALIAEIGISSEAIRTVECDTCADLVCGLEDAILIPVFRSIHIS